MRGYKPGAYRPGTYMGSLCQCESIDIYPQSARMVAVMTYSRGNQTIR